MNIPKTSQEIVAARAKSKWSGMYTKDRYARDRVMKSARLLLPFLNDGDTVLDVGCFTHEARKYFPRAVKYIGIDNVAYHAETKVVDINHGFDPIPCKAALCLETLEHLVDPLDCLQAISASLGDDGVVVVSLPNEATVFHRIRCMCGIVDAGCFSAEGKHLHLPSLSQAREFLSTTFRIQREVYYISPSACGSKQAFLGRILRLLPDKLHQWAANQWPSLFARGFIFLLKKK